MIKSITIVYFTFLSVFAFSQTNKSIAVENEKPFVLGSVVQMHSVILNENRTLNIYLPDGYNKNDTARYPVIYLLDGSADEDFIHVVGLVQYDNFPWVNRLPKSIVVGIANVDRRRDFTYPTRTQEDLKNYPTTGHSDKFILFLEKELQPFINKKYKTTESKTIIGESLGGLVAAEILIKQPDLFNKYVIISPSLWWDNGSLLDLPLDKLKASNGPKEIYIGVGKEGVSPGRNPRVMEVDANVLADKISQLKLNGTKVYFDYLPLENHATISYQALSNAFLMMSH